MKGLIYKDLSLIGRQGKFFIVYIVLMVAIFSGIGDGAASMSSFMAVVCFMLSINCFAYDEQNGFDKLVAASPLPPMQVVLSRYASSGIPHFWWNHAAAFSSHSARSSM